MITKQRSDGHTLEVQQLRNNDRVLVNLGDGRKVIVEQGGFDSHEVSVSVVWHHNNTPIAVYDEDGEEIVTLRSNR